MKLKVKIQQALVARKLELLVERSPTAGGFAEAAGIDYCAKGMLKNSKSQISNFIVQACVR